MREVEETALNEDGEEVTALREVTVRVYTLTYRGEAYFADSIFHLTAEQKTLAQNFAENLSLFLGDGLFQNLSSSESNFTIPALGNIRYTDGGTEVVYYNQLDERYANKPYGTDNIGGYGCGPTAIQRRPLTRLIVLAIKLPTVQGAARVSLVIICTADIIVGSRCRLIIMECEL